jgi:dipeptidyl aminopeptidase/acylaminoacyl peptidase
VPRVGSLLLLASALLAPALGHAQSHPILDEGYLSPPDPIARLVDSDRHTSVQLSNLSPNGRSFLNTMSEGLVELARLARPYYRLAGVAIDPAANRSRALTTTQTSGMEFIDATTGAVTRVSLPAGVRVSSPSWSPSGDQVAFLVHTDRETHAWVADVPSGRARQISRTPLLASRVTSTEWSGDGRSLFAVVIPQGRGPEPATGAAPASPKVRVNVQGSNNLRTYPSLLQDPHDRDLFAYHTTGQLVRIEVSSRRETPIGQPAMIESIDAAPGGEHIRIRTTQGPFSYIVPASQFGDREAIWNLGGETLVELERRGVREGLPNENSGNNASQRRNLRWRPDGAGLSFLQRPPAPEAEEGAPRAGNQSRPDRVVLWRAPFGDEDQEVVFESSTEIRSVEYSEDARWLFLSERVQGTERVYAVHLDDLETRFVLAESDTTNVLEPAGSLVTRPGPLGGQVVRISTDGSSVYFSGTRNFENPLEDAPRAFIDRVEIRTGERARIFESAADRFDRVTGILDDDLRQLVVTRESPTTVPDAWLLNRDSNAWTQLTRNVDHHPALTAARRERISVTRADGFTFMVDVTLPTDYREGERRPAMFWFYPREYSTQEAYDRTLRSYNRNRFPTVGPRSMEILAAAGYVVVQPDHPIVGPSDRMNDNFITDLRQNHLAVIDALDERGWIDRRRLSLGGHSYGGFGTINAMVHTPFFRAGIAGAPNSNRLLTPIGFQGERRPLWEARETYLTMSPFLYADQLSGALLIYHGEDDQNVGTFPDNSWRLIHGLNGLGKTAALYMYPFEDHGQVARETLLDMWARWIAWLDHYVRDADVSVPPAPFALADTEPEGSR